MVDVIRQVLCSLIGRVNGEIDNGFGELHHVRDDGASQVCWLRAQALRVRKQVGKVKSHLQELGTGLIYGERVSQPNPVRCNVRLLTEERCPFLLPAL